MRRLLRLRGSGRSGRPWVRTTCHCLPLMGTVGADLASDERRTAPRKGGCRMRLAPGEATWLDLHPRGPAHPRLDDPSTGSREDGALPPDHRPPGRRPGRPPRAAATAARGAARRRSSLAGRRPRLHVVSRHRPRRPRRDPALPPPPRGARPPQRAVAPPPARLGDDALRGRREPLRRFPRPRARQHRDDRELPLPRQAEHAPALRRQDGRDPRTRLPATSTGGRDSVPPSCSSPRAACRR